MAILTTSLDRRLLKKALHITLLFSFLLNGIIIAFGQKKGSKDGLSEKEAIRYSRLFIDGNKAKLLSDYEQAIKLFEACIKINPDEAAPYYELGNLYLQFGEMEAATQSASRAAELDPTNYYYRLLYAEILRNDQKFDQVATEYEKILKDFPDKIEVYFDLALVYVLKKDYQKAISVYNNLEEVIGPNEEIKLKKQYLYLQMGNVDKAAKEVEQLILLFPDNAQYYLLLAEIYYINDVDDKAMKAYKNAVEKFPENTSVHLSISEFYRSKGSYEKALYHLKLAFADPEIDIDLKVKTILSYFDLVQQKPSFGNELDELGQILLKAHPEDARVLTINGDINLNLNKPRIARKYFMKAVEVDNSRYPIWSQLLILEADLRIFDTLIIHCEEAIELFPNQPICYYFLGYGRSQVKEYNLAAEAYNRGINLIIDNDALKIQFYLGMADSYNEIKEYSLSDEAFEAILKMDSNNSVALNNYSYYLSVRGERLDQALRMSAKSNKIEPDQATYLDTYAWIFYKLKRYEEAKLWMTKAIKYGGESSGVILEHMGDILFQLNEIDEAVKYWEKAKQAGEASDLIDRKIGERKLYE